MSVEVIPKDLRSARACLVCSLIKSFEQFEFDGCDNCDEFLRMKNNRDNIYDCTSSKFEGMIALMSPEDSWVAKWQRISKISSMVCALLQCFQPEKLIFVLIVSFKFKYRIFEELQCASKMIVFVFVKRDSTISYINSLNDGYEGV